MQVQRPSGQLEGDVTATFNTIRVLKIQPAVTVPAYLPTE